MHDPSDCATRIVKEPFDPALIIPDMSLAMADGAVAMYRNFFDGYRVQQLAAVADHLNAMNYGALLKKTKKY